MNIPKHIGVILDGNRRFAKRLMIKPWKGHEWGAKKFRDFTKWCFELGVQEVTAYIFSIQNFNRPKEEFEHIMRIFEEELERLMQEENLKELNNKGTRINFIGKLQMLPEKLQELANKLMTATQDNNKKTINFAIAYGGREEILDAVVKIGKEVKEGKILPEQITEEVFGKHLWLNSEPDLIIRTGGEQRTSNFLPWQATYSELVFVEKYWPELEEQDVKQIVEEYGNRDRRYGK